MRVTQSQINRQYINSSNASLEKMTDINNKILTGKKFSKGSEDPIGAMHSLRIRNNLDEIDLYKSNLKTSENILDTADSALRTISNLMTNVTDSIISGVNGTKDSSQKEIVGNEIENFAKEMAKQMNTEYAGRKIFGGTNNSEPPIAINDSTGEVAFNGVTVNENNIDNFPENGSIPTDIGLGIKFDASGKVDEQTVLDLSMSAVKCLGYGTDSDGDSKNIIQLSMDAADALKNGDDEKARRLLDKVNNARTTLSIAIADIGGKEQTVDFSKDRIENDRLNLYAAQNAVESVDVTEEATNMKTAQMAYNATLSMSSYVIPKSIFDYMR